MVEVVLDEDELLRRVIFTDPSYIRQDNTVTSFAFKPRYINGNPETGLSVDLARLTTPAQSILDQHKYRLYSVRAGTVREIGLECEHNPIQGNQAHTLITGQITNAIAKKLSRIATRVPFP